MHYKTIIASDIHIPSPDNKKKEFLLWLKNQTFDQLIFNGDIIDGRHIKLFGGRKRRHSNWLKEVIEIAQQQGVKIKYIIGNHDITIPRTAPRLYKEMEILPDLIYDTGEKKYYICHGHQFDRLEGRFTILSKITFIGGTFLYWINRVSNEIRIYFGWEKKSFISKVKRIIKLIMVGGPGVFNKKLMVACETFGVQGIICGHLHRAEMIKIGKYEYMNSGDRIQLCTALVENDNGKREIIDTRK